MTKRLPTISIGILILFLSTLFGCSMKRKSILEIPEGFTGGKVYVNVGLPSSQLGSSPNKGT